MKYDVFSWPHDHHHVVGILYGESLNWVHGIGMISILVAVFCMGYFTAGPEGGVTTDIDVSTDETS